MNGGGKPTARGPETRRRLLDATVACLAESGLAATSARDIAARAGVNLAGIGYHFGSKDALVAEALLQAIRARLAPALEVLRREMHPVERMMLAVQALQQSLQQTGNLLAVYLEALIESRRNAPLREGVHALVRELHGFVADQIEELRAQGFLPAWVDPRAMATLQIAAVDGLALHLVVDPERVDPHAVAAQAMQLLVAARTAQS